MDKLRLTGVSCQVRIGITDEERKFPQTILLDVSVETDLSAAGRSDDLTKAVDYFRLEKILREHAQESRFNLIERLAEFLAARTLEFCPGAREVTVAVRKKPAAMPDTHEVSAQVTRSRKS